MRVGERRTLKEKMKKGMEKVGDKEGEGNSSLFSFSFFFTEKENGGRWGEGWGKRGRKGRSV